MKLVAASVPLGAGVYRILNTVTNKSYVGSSVKLRARARQHLSNILSGNHHSQKLRRSVEKHGPDSFVFEVLEQCPRESVLDRELHWIGALNSVDCGYNMRRDPASNFGIKPSDETREKISKANLGKTRSEATKRALSEATKGRDMTLPATSSADNRRGKPLPDTTRAKIAAALSGVEKSHDHKLKVADANRGKVRSPETRAKISSGQKGRAVSPAVLAKRIGRRQAPEATAKRVAKMLGVPHSTEHVEKRVAATAKTKGLDPALRGVSFHNKRQQWRARVVVAGKEIHLGWFSSQTEAVLARAAYA